MERTSLLSSKMKQQSNSSRSIRQMYENRGNNKGSSWDLGNNEYINNNSSNWGEGDLVAAGFSWPPRCYTCSFCKREFRSAQALGGHMNVHRRDRARLRMSPTRPDHNIGGNKSGAGQFSVLNPNLEFNMNSNPNSSPNFFSPSDPPHFSSLLTKFPQFTSTLPPVCPLLTANATEMKKRWDEDLMIKKGCGVFKKAEYVRLDLEIGLISQSKEELDLELRLGYS
ncbi:hypothetical protein DH2020_004747 [Rehmannia glutinosa]|uniref:C2H2-type domain-containing protein n=1 Tax=Rehmannia glutinosa TaxID=99300 RepID=A0ABR0XQB4_REHGL